MTSLVCTVRKGIITIIENGKAIEFVNHRVKTREQNTIHVGKRCAPINFYLKNGRWSSEMSESRKLKLSRLDMDSIKAAAVNNIKTQIELNKLK